MLEILFAGHHYRHACKHGVEIGAYPRFMDFANIKEP